MPMPPSRCQRWFGREIADGFRRERRFVRWSSQFRVLTSSIISTPFYLGFFQSEILVPLLVPLFRPLVGSGCLDTVAAYLSPHLYRSTSFLPLQQQEPTRFHLAGSVPRQSSCNPPRSKHQTDFGSSTESSFGSRAVLLI